jgi:hypothetical protein
MNTIMRVGDGKLTVRMLGLALSMLFVAVNAIQAQTEWTTNGSNISNTNGGNVGVGTTTPGRLLTVQANVPNGVGGSVAIINNQYANNNGAETELIFSHLLNNGAPFRYAKLHTVGADIYGSVNRFSLGITNNSDVFTDYLTVLQGGNVGVGTIAPRREFHVEGNVLNGANSWYYGSTPAGADQPLIRSRGTGYDITQSTYRGLQIGQVNDHIAMFIDPGSVAGGNFSGNANELMLPNNVRFLQANSASADWIYNNGAGTLALDNGNVGIGMASPIPNSTSQETSEERVEHLDMPQHCQTTTCK